MTLPLVSEYSAKKTRSLHLLSGWGSSGKEVKRYSGHWHLSAPSSPLLPLGPAGQLEEPDFGLADTQSSKGRKGRPPDTRTRVGVLQRPRKGVSFAQDGTARAGEGLRVHPRSQPRIPPQPGSQPLHWAVGALLRKARALQLGRPDMGQAKAQVPQSLSMQVVEMGRQLREPSDGSPAAK